LTSVRIETGATEPVTVKATRNNGQDLTGLTDLFIRVRRFSDGLFFDFSDSTFKASPVSINSAALVEVSATNAPGLYELSGGFDFSAITNVNADDTYSFIPIQTPGTNAVLPGPGEVKEGQFVDDITNASAQADKIDLAATVAPGAATTGSLLDRLANKDSSKTFDQSTDSLEATRDRIG